MARTSVSLGRILYCLAAAAVWLPAWLPAWLSGAKAQEFPNRPIRLIVSAGPGSTTDQIARYLSIAMERHVRQPIIVENRPGAFGLLAVNAVANSAPDGYTLLFTRASLAFPRGLKAISSVTRSPIVVAVGASSPAKTLKDIVDLAKGGKFSFASLGPGSTSHNSAVQFFALSGISESSVTHVPFRSGEDALKAVMSRQADGFFEEAYVLLPHLTSGSLHALAVASPTKLGSLDVPTTAQAGFPSFNKEIWTVLFAPTGIDERLLSKLQNYVKSAAQTEDMRAALARLWMQPGILGIQELDAVIQSPPVCCASKTCGDPKICEGYRLQ